MNTPNHTKLFIYGTLKRGGVRAAMLNQQQFLAEVRSTPRYRLFDTGDYPALVESQPLGLAGLAIHGELWSVTADCLAQLDEEEGVEEGLYKRRPIELINHADTVQTYLYLLSTTGMADCGISWAVRG